MSFDESLFSFFYKLRKRHKNELNDSWIDLQPAQNNGTKMEIYYRKRQVDVNGNFVSDLVNADINSDAYWGNKAQFETVTLTPQNGIYRWNINSLVPSAGFENYEYFYKRIHYCLIKFAFL